MTAPHRRRRHGAALITTMILMAILAMMVASLLLYVSKQRMRSIASTRAVIRASCAEAGLQYARTYFGRNPTSWDNFLAAPGTFNSTNPHPYNPIYSDAGNLFPGNPRTDAGQAFIKQFNSGAGAALFVDLDGDNKDDAYIYIRDNDDEKLPAASDWERDNDQNVIVGSMCISSTMVPRRDGIQDPDALLVEGILAFNTPGSGYSGQSNCGTSGTGNCN